MLQDIAKELQPHIVELGVTLIVALGGLVKTYVALLAARTEAQRQAVLGAAHQVDQLVLDNADKKRAVVELAAQRLPDRLTPREEKLGALVEQVMPQVKAARSSEPPEA